MITVALSFFAHAVFMFVLASKLTHVAQILCIINACVDVVLGLLVGLASTRVVVAHLQNDD